MYGAWKIMIYRLFSIFLTVTYSCIYASEIALYENILCADYASITRQPNAEKYYKKVLRCNSSQASQSNYCKHLFEHGEFAKFIEFSQKCPNLFGQNNHDELYGFMLAQAYQAVNDPRSATLFKELANLYPGNLEIAFYALSAYLQEEQYNQVLMMIKKLYANNRQAKFHYVFNFIAYQAHYALHNYVEAKKNLQRSIILHPKFEQGWLLMAVLEERLGNIENAKRGYQYLFDITGDTLIAQKLMKLKAVETPQVDGITIIRKEIASGNFSEAQRIFDDASLKSQSAEEIEEYALLQLDIFMGQKMYSNACQYVCSQIQKSKNELWLKIGHLFYLRIPDQGIKRKFRNFLLRFANEKNELDSLLYVFDLFLRTDLTASNSRLVYSLARKIVAICRESDLTEKVIFQCTQYAWQRRDFKEVQQFLSYPQVSKATYKPLLNLAAYFYASKGSSEKLAQVYLQKLNLDTQSCDISLLDTKAFVLYKTGNFLEAFETLQSQDIMLQTDATLLRHYGKICACLGKKTQARNAFEKAFTCERDANKKRQLTRLLASLKN